MDKIDNFVSMVDQLKKLWKRLLNPISTNKVGREEQEDFLKALYEQGESASPTQAQSICEQLHISSEQASQLIGALILSEEIEGTPLRLTDKGRRHALRIIRAHRIYEQYLAEHSGYRSLEWHKRAHKKEHEMSTEEAEHMNALLRNPLYDPHGDPIPSPSLEIPRQPVEYSDSLLHSSEWFRVLHIEDDQDELFYDIDATGLARNSIFQITNFTEDTYSFIYEGESFTLPRHVLQAISLEAISEEQLSLYDEVSSKRLTRLAVGQQAQIVGLSPSCRGPMRRRLMDLGFVRGSSISVDMASPMGNPTAYVVRGSAIALRADQAKYILVK